VLSWSADSLAMPLASESARHGGHGERRARSSGNIGCRTQNSLPHGSRITQKVIATGGLVVPPDRTQALKTLDLSLNVICL